MKFISMETYGKELTSKSMASAIRSGLNLTDKINFDFSGVDKVSSEFIAALFGSIMENFGEKAFNDHFRISGLPIDVQSKLKDILVPHTIKR